MICSSVVLTPASTSGSRPLQPSGKRWGPECEIGRISRFNFANPDLIRFLQTSYSVMPKDRICRVQKNPSRSYTYVEREDHESWFSPPRTSIECSLFMSEKSLRRPWLIFFSLNFFQFSSLPRLAQAAACSGFPSNSAGKPQPRLPSPRNRRTEMMIWLLHQIYRYFQCSEYRVRTPSGRRPLKAIHMALKQGWMVWQVIDWVVRDPGHDYVSMRHTTSTISKCPIYDGRIIDPHHLDQPWPPWRTGKILTTTGTPGPTYRVKSQRNVQSVHWVMKVISPKITREPLMVLGSFSFTSKLTLKITRLSVNLMLTRLKPSYARSLCTHEKVFNPDLAYLYWRKSPSIGLSAPCWGCQDFRTIASALRPNLTPKVETWILLHFGLFDFLSPTGQSHILSPIHTEL